MVFKTGKVYMVHGSYFDTWFGPLAYDFVMQCMVCLSVKCELHGNFAMKPYISSKDALLLVNVTPKKVACTKSMAALRQHCNRLSTILVLRLCARQVEWLLLSEEPGVSGKGTSSAFDSLRDMMTEASHSLMRTRGKPISGIQTGAVHTT